ncbi:A/G-specific adenine glycosylase [Nitrosovibrio tenuis]|uniref:Adenine DNA glycosylase n=1 Tax=Nitrosovibrio tenuis TaxID=1233 RepID=A0A1H7P540_9PROT|nr:A/G-specific adenine glycosylase [Nitrosovibrio tenuis]SEL30237.1 A/G-specific DNA-adenine glycosylase [Nitrosovibrio tenuis]
MSSFAEKMIRWQESYGRHHLPWQNIRDPYVIWVSEVMLQQTQVTTVIPYYLRFLQRFPDLNSLASASLDEVLAQWSGLGYYSRGRNLHRTAQLIVRDHQGIFPEKVEVICQLPGVGRSTAAAIAVFAYGARCAILDGNVKRILARCFGIERYPGERKIEALLWQKAQELLPEQGEKDVNGGIEAYTQALMDLGATVCTRIKPKCAICPLQSDCTAFRNDAVGRLPAPKPRKPMPERETVLLMLMAQGKILLEKRPARGIWGGLWCLPEMPVSENAIEYCARHFGMEVQPLPPRIPSFVHIFTHFRLRIHPHPLQLNLSSSATTGDHIGVERMWTTLADALTVAIPAPVAKLLNMAVASRNA